MGCEAADTPAWVIAQVIIGWERGLKSRLDSLQACRVTHACMQQQASVYRLAHIRVKHLLANTMHKRVRHLLARRGCRLTDAPALVFAAVNR